jgi:hypothetical protein
MYNLFKLIIGSSGILLVISTIGGLFRKKNFGSRSKPHDYSLQRLDPTYYFISPVIIGIILIIIAVTN